MENFALTQPMVESFPPTQKSPMARARIWLWTFTGLCLVLVTMASDITGGRLLFVIGLMLVLAAAADFAFRRQLKRDRSVVQLTMDGIESLNFSGKQTSYRWKDVSAVSVEPKGNAHALQLELLPGTSPAANAGAWSARRRNRPCIPLARYSAPEQERLLDAVIQRLRQSHPGITATNTLRQEREFAENLIAFAPHTWVTYGLVCANVLVWFIMVIKGADAVKPSVEMLLHWGGNAASEVQRGQWWRMVSATFLHSGLVHLAMNMVGLWSIGQTVERIYGHRPYLMIYLGSAITGSALSLHFSAQKAVSVGASGAVFGVAGALLVAVYGHRKTLPKIFSRQNLSGLGFFVLYSLAQGFTQRGIDNGAHIGGLLAGCLMAYILPERFDLQRYAALLQRRSVLAVATVMGLAASISLSAPPAYMDVQRLFAGAAAFDKGFKGFEEASKLAQQLHARVKSGQMTELELDAKSRSVLAPAYRKAMADLSQAWLAPEDPRNDLLQEVRRMTALVIEITAMESVVQEGTQKPEPVDPARMKLLSLELKESADRMKAIRAKLKAGAKVPSN